LSPLFISSKKISSLKFKFLTWICKQFGIFSFHFCLPFPCLFLNLWVLPQYFYHNDLLVSEDLFTSV
jgi:hypothetical protein